MGAESLAARKIWCQTLFESFLLYTAAQAGIYLRHLPPAVVKLKGSQNHVSVRSFSVL